MQNPTKPVLRIRAIRESKGYTQEYMAEMLGICQSTYANLESGKTTLSVSRLLKISDILERDFTELIDYKRPGERQDKTLNPSASLVQPNFNPETKSVYEQLIREMRSEIDFLRSLIRVS